MQLKIYYQTFYRKKGVNYSHKKISTTYVRISSKYDGSAFTLTLFKVFRFFEVFYFLIHQRCCLTFNHL